MGFRRARGEDRAATLFRDDVVQAVLSQFHTVVLPIEAMQHWSEASSEYDNRRSPRTEKSERRTATFERSESLRSGRRSPTAR